MNRWVPALRLTGIGFYIAICILMGTGAGLWLDDKFGISPVCTVIGILAGLGLAVYGVYRMLRLLLKDNNNGEQNS